MSKKSETKKFYDSLISEFKDMLKNSPAIEGEAIINKMAVAHKLTNFEMDELRKRLGNKNLL